MKGRRWLESSLSTQLCNSDTFWLPCWVKVKIKIPYYLVIWWQFPVTFQWHLLPSFLPTHYQPVWTYSYLFVLRSWTFQEQCPSVSGQHVLYHISHQRELQPISQNLKNRGWPIVALTCFFYEDGDLWSSTYCHFHPLHQTPSRSLGFEPTKRHGKREIQRDLR